MVIEVIFLGRGGQGVVTACRVLAEAWLRSGFYVQSFPEFGPERSGAPVRAYLRVSESPIGLHLPVELGDALTVFDINLLNRFPPQTLVKENGLVVVNSRKPIPLPGLRAVTVDGAAITQQVGKPKALGMAMIGGLSAAIGRPPLEALEEAVGKNFGERDVEAVRAAYRSVMDLEAVC